MEDEKMLPVGEPATPTPVSPIVPVYKPPSVPAYVPPAKPAPAYIPPNLPGIPSPKQQSWGVVISIVIIVLMIIIGAFYAWGQRIAQNQNLTAPATAQ